MGVFATPVVMRWVLVGVISSSELIDTSVFQNLLLRVQTACSVKWNFFKSDFLFFSCMAKLPD